MRAIAAFGWTHGGAMIDHRAAGTRVGTDQRQSGQRFQFVELKKYVKTQKDYLTVKCIETGL